MPSFAIDFSYAVSFFKPKASFGQAIVEESQQRFFHHIVLTGTYYGSTTNRFDAVLVRADNAKLVTKFKNGEFLLRFAADFAFHESVKFALEEKNAAFIRSLPSLLLSLPGQTRWFLCNVLK